jgi:hypothetical protein
VLGLKKTRTFMFFADAQGEPEGGHLESHSPTEIEVASCQAVSQAATQKESNNGSAQV